MQVLSDNLAHGRYRAHLSFSSAEDMAWHPKQALSGDHYQRSKTVNPPARGLFSRLFGRMFGAVGWGTGLTLASLLGGVALISTGPLGCIPGLLLLLLAPMAAIGGGVYGLMKKRKS